MRNPNLKLGRIEDKGNAFEAGGQEYRLDAVGVLNIGHTKR
jgi:hypothetical protein